MSTYEFTLEESTPRANKVDVSEIPKEFVAQLNRAWDAVKLNPNQNVVFKFENNAEVVNHGIYARSWGNGHKPDRVTVRKLPERKGEEGKNLLRLGMEKYDPNATPLGRRPNSPNPTE